MLKDYVTAPRPVYRTERDAFQSYRYQMQRNPPLAPRGSTMPGRFHEPVADRLRRAARLLRELWR